MPEIIEKKAPDLESWEDENAPQIEDVDAEREVWMPPNAPKAEQSQAENPLIEKEALLLSGEPMATFEIPSGRTLRIYPKSDGQMRRINFAFVDWMDAEGRADRQIEKRRWLRFWWRYKVSTSLLDAQTKKTRFFQAIFEDAHVPDRHDDLPAEEFLTIPLDQQAAIYAAYKKANDGTALLRAILGDEVFDAKKKHLSQAIQRVYTPI